MKSRAKPWLGPLLLAVLAVAATVLAQSAAGQSLLRESGLSPAPESYTEMAFEHAGKLPDRISSRRPTATTFRMRNLEGSHRQYDWTVEQHRGDGSGGRVLRRGRTPLRSGDSAVIRASYRPVCDAPKLRIDIRLGEPRQSIGYWVACR